MNKLIKTLTLATSLMVVWGLVADNVLADNPHEAGHAFPGPFTPPSQPGNGNQDPPEDCPKISDPVYLYRGDVEYVRDDISIPGKGLPLEVTLRYWSQREYNNRYGYGWFMCYNVRLVLLADNSIEVLLGCGGQDNYTDDPASDVYDPPTGAYAVLTKVGGTGYTLEQTNGTVYSFDANGRLTSITDRNDNEITFAYNATGPLPIVGKSKYVTGTSVAATLAYDWMLTAITDTKGDDLDFQYNANGRLETITDYTGRQWEYNYSNDDNLEFITTPAISGFPAGLVTELDYDGHHLLTVKDPEGQTSVTNMYHSDGRLWKQTLGTGTMVLTYNDITRTTTMFDGEGFKTEWTFNADGQVTRKKAYTDGVPAGEPAFYETIYTYGTNSKTITLPRNNSIKFTYDARGNVIEERRKKIGVTTNDSSDIVTAATYDQTHGGIDTFTDAKGNVTDYDYDTSGNGNLKEIVYPTVGGTSPTVTVTYTNDGQVELLTDPNGHELKYEYFPDTGYLKKIRIDPDDINAIIELTYDDVGNIIAIKDPRDNTTTLAYNAMDWLTTITNPLGYQTKFAYYGTGRVKKIERQANTLGTSWQTTQFTYTGAGYLKTVTSPLSKVTTYNYDDNNNLVSIVDAEDKVTGYTYDERDLLWKATDALGKVIEYGYDANGNLKTIEDAREKVTTFKADDFDRLIRLTYDNGNYERVALDRNGNADSLLVGTSVHALYSWDALGRLGSISYPGEDTVTYTYDPGFRLLEAANDAGATTYSYDALGRVDSVTTVVGSGQQAQTYGVGYRYDKASNRTKLFYPSGYYVNSTYTSINLVDDLQHPTGPPIDSVIVDYQYDTLGRRVFREIPAQLRFVQSFYEYDGANRLTRILNRTLRPDPGEEQPEPSWGMREIWRRLKNWVNRPAWAGTGITISDFVYTYDDAGHRSSMTVDDSTQTYGYDDVYRLTSVSGARSHTYDYDDVGNRETAAGTLNGASYSYSYTANSLNQYSAVSGVNYTYDSRGNLTGDGVKTYAYEQENRLVSVSGGGNSVAYTYDGFGRRQTRSVNGTQTHFVYDGDHLLAEYNTSGSLQREYVYGAYRDEVVSLRRTSPSSRYFYFQDGLGSISEIVDFNGVLAEQYEYTPFGETTIRKKNGDKIATSAIANRFAFTGRWLEYETSLYDLRARSYHPKSGRFISRDPIRSGINLYAYVRNDPINFVDPLGLYDDASPWQLAGEWMLGRDEDPRAHYFTDGDPFAEMLREHEFIQDLIEDICRGKTPNPGGYSLEGLKGVPIFFKDIATILSGGLIGNLGVTYLGSYNYTYAVSDGILHIHVWNATTASSATRLPKIGYTDWWTNNIANPLDRFFAEGPYSRTEQYFDLHENLNDRGCNCD